MAKQYFLRLAGAALAAAVIVGAGPSAAQSAMGQGGPTTVGVYQLEESDVPFQLTVPGRAVAFEQVDIRPRVSGVIAEILYEPGRRIESGTPLFRIDGDTYAADLEAAQAAVDGAQAALEAAQATLSRYERLQNTSVTVEDVDTARVNAAQAAATLRSAQAARDTAQLNLDRTEIDSPISGLVEVSSVSVGAIVTANQSDALTTVTRLDPIYVDVEESSKRIQEVRDQIEAGTLKRGEEADISLLLETGRSYDGKGTFVSPGTSVSATTGTTVLRLQFDNPDRRILPGQFLRVDITIGTSNAVLVPQRATSRASDGTLTAFVAEDGKAVERTLTEQGSYENAWIVTDGVRAGDMLILDGLTNLTAGAEITTVPVTISADGVVTDADPAPETAQSSESE